MLSGQNFKKKLTAEEVSWCLKTQTHKLCFVDLFLFIQKEKKNRFFFFLWMSSLAKYFFSLFCIILSNFVFYLIFHSTWAYTFIIVNISNDLTKRAKFFSWAQPKIYIYFLPVHTCGLVFLKILLVCLIMAAAAKRLAARQDCHRPSTL